MLKSILYKVILLLSLFGVSSAEAEAVSQAEPSQMVSQVANQLIAQIKAQRSELIANPAKVKGFAQAYVLPYMDASKMARYAMGRYWRTATKHQKEEFVEEFTEMLMRSYAGSILKLDVESVVVKPAKISKPGRATVSSEVTLANGQKHILVYRLFLNKKTHKWMMYDVSIEGISLLLNYRKVYASEFSTKGIDEVVEAMEDKNKAFLKNHQMAKVSE